LLTSIRELSVGPHALERRLLFSHLAAFAAIFVVAAVGVHFAFVAILEHQTALRLADLARAGMRSVDYAGRKLAIDQGDIANKQLLTREQGLQWYDRQGKLLGEQGFVPPAGAQRSFNNLTMEFLNPKTHRPEGFVTASESNAQERADIWYLDIGLFFSALLAAAASAAGGRALARRAVQPVERSFQTLREFTDNAAHELRGPLTAIATSADAALRDERRDPARDRFRFEAISDGARQMSRLTSDLLLLAGADRSLERELFLVDLKAMLARLGENFRPAFLAAGIAFDLETENVSPLYGNPHQVERVVGNLIENALRYTPRGGSVRVELRQRGIELQVVVRDSGPGIAPEHLERIFERFWRVDPLRGPEGSGLGLAIARALARRHGGDVTVSSEPGVGSTFVASLRLRPRAARTAFMT
jgi:two-component system, OmpR family, manganese sensing sensor histidine kinase